MNISNTKLILKQEAPWLVMIHGFGGSKKMWNKQIDAFSDRYNIMILELPGHGDSPIGLSEYENVSLQDIAEAIINLLLSEKIFCASFICVSMATLIMSAIAEVHPEMISSVVFCGAVFGMNRISELTFRAGNYLKYILPYMAMVKILAMILMPNRTHKISRKFLVLECRNLGRAEFLRWYSLLTGEIYRLHDHMSCFKGIQSLVIMGSEDHVFLKDAISSLLNFRNRIKLKTIRNCGHVCSLQKWREFNAISAEFLDSVSFPVVKPVSLP